MQLDACLRSLDHFAPYRGQTVVLYRASTPDFADGYRLVANATSAKLVEESGEFRRDVLELIEAGSEYTVFHTDDDVFFRAPSAVPALTDAIAALSFRLGLNTIYSYAVARPQAVPELLEAGEVVAWDWTKAQHDFGYPMSLDGHVLRTRLLLPLLARIRFDNPNELEEELAMQRHRVPPWMMAFSQSCLVSIPVNTVSATHANRSGGDPSLSPEALNARFLAGERIDLGAMDFGSVRGAHQELPLAFEQSGG